MWLEIFGRYIHIGQAVGRQANRWGRGVYSVSGRGNQSSSCPFASFTVIVVIIVYFLLSPPFPFVYGILFAAGFRG